MDSSVFGRDAELGAVDRFLAAAEHSLVPNGALVLEGPSGIGKSAIWREAIARATQRGIRTLQCRPAEAEKRLSYSALTDLVESAYEDVRDTLPPPQQQALDATLLRGTLDRRTDPRTTGTAVVSVLRALTSNAPVLLAIDDLQWLDRASARALEFAVRRLPTRVHLLIALRRDSSDVAPLGVSEALSERALDRIELGPLPPQALYRMIRARLGTAPSRPVFVRIASTSGGNPLFALEVARALGASVDPVAEDIPLPLPARLHDVIATRVRSLSSNTRDVLLAVSMLSPATESRLVAVFGSRTNVDSALDAAEDAELIVRNGAVIRFTHPLLASAVYRSVSRSRRNSMRRRLADVVSDPEERARHLAHAVDSPDAAAALEIEVAAEVALRRGAPDSAGDLYEAAARLTPLGQSTHGSRRRRAAAGARLAAGDPAAARVLANAALAEATSQRETAEALLVLGQIAWVEMPGREPIEHLEHALQLAGEDSRLRGRIHARLAEYWLIDHRRVVEHSDAAAELLDEDEDASALASALLNKAFFSAQLGRGAPGDLVARALAIEERAGPDVERNRVGLIWLTCMDETALARARHRLEDQWYADRGEEGWRAERLAHLALANFYAGDWKAAERDIDESCAAIEQMGQPLGPWGMVFYIRSIIDVHQGRGERAEPTLLALYEELERIDHRFFAAIVLSALGTLRLVTGDPASASQAFAQMHAHLDAIGTVDPVGIRVDPDEIEALLAIGDHATARGVLEHLEWRHATLPRRWTAVALSRARALVLAAGGDAVGGLEALATPDLQSAERVPLEYARNLLVQGRLHRRLRQRGVAAEVLTDALERFVKLGAVTWERITRAELARIGLRRPASGDLTPSELVVAGLAAEGLRNREIATTAFMSPKTVEANLARVYSKLGIRSRAELGARMTDRQRVGDLHQEK
jgi:DNA-binding CsgD family transcriptional regulator